MARGVAIDDGLVDAVSVLAQRAGERVLEVYEEGFTIGRKADNSLVTAADLAADEAIVAGLTDLGTGWPVLSEESETPPYGERRRWGRYWLVDPLDGTRGFVDQNGEFVVNIALIDRGWPVLGVVYVPVSRACYAARVGAGATRREAGSSAQSVRTRPWRDGQATVATGRWRRNPLTREFIERLAPKWVLQMGSALKSCRVAEGAADVYPGFSRTSEWDTAAPQCIVEEAGGRVMDASGHRLRYNTGPSLENPPFLVVGDPGADWSRWLPPGLGPPVPQDVVPGSG